MESTPSYPPSGTPPPPGWWSRNWKWVVPTGCFTGCLASIALAFTFGAAIVALVFGAFKSSDAYKTAVARAKAHPAVVEALGTPIEEGLFLSGKTNVNGPSGEADLSVPLSGPKGKGTLYVVATKTAGQWTYQTLVFEVAQSGHRIDLNSSSDQTGTDEQ